MVVMVVVCPLGLPGGLLLKRGRVDAVLFQDLVPGTLQDCARFEVLPVCSAF